MGNADKTKKDNIVRHKLNHLLEARYIRFNPLTWSQVICMRVDVYACEVPMIELPTTLPTTRGVYHFKKILHFSNSMTYLLPDPFSL